MDPIAAAVDAAVGAAISTQVIEDPSGVAFTEVVDNASIQAMNDDADEVEALPMEIGEAPDSYVSMRSKKKCRWWPMRVGVRYGSRVSYRRGTGRGCWGGLSPRLGQDETERP